MSAPITVIGIGEDGLDGLSPAARALVDGAEVLIGGERHLDKAPHVQAERLDWSEGFVGALDEIERRLDKRIVVLASGDPLYFGVGATLIRRFGRERVCVLPAPGAVSLTCARMGWSQPDIQVVTIHGRPLESLNLHLAPGARLVVLARDGKSPAEVADLLTKSGFGASNITVLEHLGGENEIIRTNLAENWPDIPCADLNTLAIACVAGKNARFWSRLAGLPDDAFEHDGQLTKREVRAVTLSSLAPLPGETLWDVGAGAGSIAIEWMRADRSCAAVAIERDGDRAARIARNAMALGVPRLRIETQNAQTALEQLDGAPDAVFVGGGVANPGLLDAAWARLKPGGRLVANAVTLEGVEALAAFRRDHGGELVQLSVARAAPKTAAATLFAPMRALTQLICHKSLD